MWPSTTRASRAPYPAEGGPSMHATEQIQRFHADMTAWRRDIHAHPELGFEETRTADLVARQLEAFGIEVHRGIGKTGVVGVLRAGDSGAHDRPARRHGRAADPGGQHLRPPFHARRQDARLRPRRPHRDAARRREVPGRDETLRRHRALHLPAGRGRHRRRARDDRRRPVQALPLRRRSSACTTGPACRSGSSRCAPGR